MKFITTPQELNIILDRREQLAALKAKLNIKKTDVVSVEWHDIFSDWRRWEVRLPGSAIPRVLIAGSYWTEEGWDFLYLKRPVGVKVPTVDDVLVICLNGDNRYQRVAISASHQDYQLVKKWYSSKDDKKKK